VRLVIEPGRDQELAETILTLSSHAELRSALGQRARAMLDAHFTRDLALQRWRRLHDGMEQTYRWIYDQVKTRAEGRNFFAIYE
jgi:hypothetical protein